METLLVWVLPVMCGSHELSTSIKQRMDLKAKAPFGRPSCELRKRHTAGSQLLNVVADVEEASRVQSNAEQSLLKGVGP